jgi:hypothetical protein
VIGSISSQIKQFKFAGTNGDGSDLVAESSGHGGSTVIIDLESKFPHYPPTNITEFDFSFDIEMQGEEGTSITPTWDNTFCFGFSHTDDIPNKSDTQNFLGIYKATGLQPSDAKNKYWFVSNTQFHTNVVSVFGKQKWTLTKNKVILNNKVISLPFYSSWTCENGVTLPKYIIMRNPSASSNVKIILNKYTITTKR